LHYDLQSINFGKSTSKYTESKVLINGHTSRAELYGREGVSSWKSWKRGSTSQLPRICIQIAFFFKR